MIKKSVHGTDTFIAIADGSSLVRTVDNFALCRYVKYKSNQLFEGETIISNIFKWFRMPLFDSVELLHTLLFSIDVALQPDFFLMGLEIFIIATVFFDFQISAELWSFLTRWYPRLLVLELLFFPISIILSWIGIKSPTPSSSLHLRAPSLPNQYIAMFSMFAAANIDKRPVVASILLAYPIISSMLTHTNTFIQALLSSLLGLHIFILDRMWSSSVQISLLTIAVAASIYCLLQKKISEPNAGEANPKARIIASFGFLCFYISLKVCKSTNVAIGIGFISHFLLYFIGRRLSSAQLERERKAKAQKEE